MVADNRNDSAAMKTDGKATAIYVRVSSRQQNIESQLPDLNAYADSLKAQGKRVMWYEDSATGRKMERPGMLRMLQDMESGLIDTVVFWRLDRLGRTTRGVCNFFAHCQERGVNVVSLRDKFDLSTTIGRLQAHILASVAEFETELRAERQAAGIAASKAKVAEIQRLARAGWTYDAIARVMKLKPEQVERVVKTGRIWWGGCAPGRQLKRLPSQETIYAWMVAGMKNREIAKVCECTVQSLYNRLPMTELRRRARAERKAKLAAGIRIA